MWISQQIFHKHILCNRQTDFVYKAILMRSHNTVKLQQVVTYIGTYTPDQCHNQNTTS